MSSGRGNLFGGAIAPYLNFRLDDAARHADRAQRLEKLSAIVPCLAFLRGAQWQEEVVRDGV
jgi:hypothetical protein